MIIRETKLDMVDVLIQPKRSTLSSRKEVKLERKFKTKHEYEFECIPIIASNMTCGNFAMSARFAANNMLVAIAKHYHEQWMEIAKNRSQKDYLLKLLKNSFYTVGNKEIDLDRLHYFRNELACLSKIDEDEFDNVKICVDIANGYSQSFADHIRKIRNRYPKNLIMAGNVCTPEMTQELIIAGADIIKIGIGPGSACTTRLKTGVGYPQISAAIECADVAHGLNAFICLDGGMRSPADIAKAFGANSDFVMIGGMLAGTDECEGEIITKYEHDGTYEKIRLPGNDIHYGFKENIIEKKYKTWYGMSSKTAQEKHFNGMNEYRTSEGAEYEVPYIGPVQNVINDILGGLRSCGTYIGASEIKHFGKCTTFIKVNRAHDKF